MGLVETTNTDLSGNLAMTSLKAMLDLHQHKSTAINTDHSGLSADIATSLLPFVW